LIGLTGGVAAGKSEALSAFARHDAATLSTDAVVHELLGEPEVHDRLVERWGGRVVADGRIDRDEVGAIVFDSPDELRWLEALLHPLVGARVAEWLQSLPPDTSVAVVEVPLLFETGMEPMFDATVTVVAPDEVRARRAGDRGTNLLEGRSERQLSQDEKAERATYTIHNDGSLAELDAEIARVVPVLADLGKEAP
jgi:dephospho-CoA kinase